MGASFYAPDRNPPRMVRSLRVATLLAGASIGLLSGCAPTIKGAPSPEQPPPQKQIPLEVIATTAAQNDEIAGGVAAIGCFPIGGPVPGLSYQISYGDGTTSTDPGFPLHIYKREGTYLVECDATGPGEAGSASVVVTIR